ncbi:MAG: IPT/TIG domain-containing protein, partial [bacterium]
MHTVLPTNVISGEHQHVTIYGSHFRQSPELKCQIDKTIYTAFFTSSSLIVCHVAEHGPGSLSVEVSNNGVDFSRNGVSATFWRSPAPVILTSLQPCQGPQAGQTIVIVTGGGWHHNSEIMCLFGGFRVFAKQNVSAISCQVPRLNEFAREMRSHVHGLPATEIEIQVSIDGVLVPG